MIFEFEDYAPVNGQGVSSFNGDQRPCREPLESLSSTEGDRRCGGVPTIDGGRKGSGDVFLACWLL